MSNEEIKEYNTSIKISTILVIISFFIATIIFSAISIIFSTKAYNVGKYDYRKRKKAILLQSIAFFSAGFMSMMNTNKNSSIFEMLIASVLGCLLYFFVMVKITNNKYGKEELDEIDEDYSYVCPTCKRELEYGIKYCKFCSTEINWGDEKGNNIKEDNDDEIEYDEDLEDMYSDEDEDYIDEDMEEEDEFFKEEFEFSYAKVKEVLKKIGYDNYATFKKEVYNSKKIKRKKFEEKEEEVDYLVKALGYDDFEDFYITNMEN